MNTNNIQASSVGCSVCSSCGMYYYGLHSCTWQYGQYGFRPNQDQYESLLKQVGALEFEVKMLKERLNDISAPNSRKSI